MAYVDVVPAGRADLLIRQGVTFRLPVGWKPGGDLADLTGYSARFQIRASYDADEPVVDCSTANGHITILPPGGDFNLVIELSAAETDALVDWGRGVYDLELVAPTGQTRTLLEGYAVLGRQAVE